MSGELKKVSIGGKFLGTIVLFLVFALVIQIWRFFGPGEKDMDEKRGEARSAKLEALQKENEQKLSVYAWVNKDKGVVQLPVDAAMKLVAAELAAKPVKASEVKVENPYPYGLQNLSFAPVPAGTGTAAASSGTAAPRPAASGTSSPAPAASGTAAPPAVSGTTAPSPAPAASGSASPVPVESGTASSGSSATPAPAVTPTPPL